MSTVCEVGYLALHLYHILRCSSYEIFILVAHRFRHYTSPATKAYLEHDYKLVSPHRLLPFLLNRLRILCALSPLLTRPDGSFHFFTDPKKPNGSSPTTSTKNGFYCSHFDRNDTPSAAFLRIIRTIPLLPTSAPSLQLSLGNEIQEFWRRGITGVSRPDYFLFGGQWYIKDLPDPREMLGNDPLLCAIAASTAEHMVEVFNWRIGLGIRRDLTLLRARKPYWDENLAPCPLESAPEWCKEVGPAPVQTVVDGREDVTRGLLESKAISPSPSFKKRNLLANSQFMYFA